MTSRNIPSLRSIATDPTVLRALSLDALDALLTEAEAENKIISAAKRAITNHIEDAYKPAILGAYAAKGADFGSVRVSDGGYEIVVDTPKRVEWDGLKLSAIEAAIRDGGDDPTEYITVERKVDERKYAAWPAHLRNTFEDARTVRPGTRTVKLARKSDDEAPAALPVLKAMEGCCEEASPQSHAYYIPCNAPATRLVKLRGEGPYRMCEMCADHNVRNRGGQYCEAA